LFALIATQARKTHQRLAFLHVSKIPLCTYTVYIYFHIFKYEFNCTNILIIDLTWHTIHNILRLMSIINGRNECIQTLYLQIMYVYCVYPLMSNLSKQMQNCFKIPWSKRRSNNFRVYAILVSYQNNCNKF
jgi:hypothetical protein